MNDLYRFQLGYKLTGCFVDESFSGKGSCDIQKHSIYGFDQLSSGSMQLKNGTEIPK